MKEKIGPIVAIALLVAIGYAALRDDGGKRIAPHPFEICVERGTKYFTDIGSFPRLSDGRDAVTVVQERCRRSTRAFGPWG